MTSVLILDDHPLLRRGLVETIKDAGYLVAGQAGTLAEARDCWFYLDWTVALLDINFPDGNGLDFLREMRAKGCSRNVLVHSFSPADSGTLKAIKASAQGYLSKDCPPSELIQAIDAVSKGMVYAKASLISGLSSASLQSIEQLSPKEKEVFELLGQGLPQKTIAGMLGITPSSVATHKRRIKAKLNLTTDRDLLLYSINKDS